MKRCTRCVLTDKEMGITFDANGVCSYCHQHDRFEKEFPTGKEGMKRLKKLAAQMKKDGKGSKFDVVIGVSGGCDSSYTCYIAKKILKLRVLAAHADNGWDTPISKHNMKTVLKKLGIPLYNAKVNKEEFALATRAFFLAGLPEVDNPSDTALITVIYQACEKYNVKHNFIGHSFRTEGVAPLGWTYCDARYVEDVIQKHKGVWPVKTLPMLKLGKWIDWMLMGIQRHRPLYYIDYNKEDTKHFLMKHLGWKWYGGHHMENDMAIFGCNFNLPVRHKIDMRRVELSALVRSGQMSREQAIHELSIPLECPERVMKRVKKAWHMTDATFDWHMKQKTHLYTEYDNYRPYFKAMRPFFKVMLDKKLIPLSFYEKFTQ